MKIFKDKTCKCGVVFVPTAPAERYCPSCKIEALAYHKKQNARRAYNYRRKQGCKIGAGAPRGADHPNYKHGRFTYETLRKEIKASRGSCERCNTDLTAAGHYEWVIHHKDHNQYNSSISNLELLCKSCHQIEHECHKNFEGATTIRKE